MGHEKTRLGKWGSGGVDGLLRAGCAIASLPARIDFISAAFLGVPYAASTLIGSPEAPEALVIDLSAVDCFTYLDYVEAMRLSRSLEEFRQGVRTVRYKSGKVAYGARNHFFTDWTASARVDDVTAPIGQAQARSALKTLNRKGDGAFILPGVPQESRRVCFLPSAGLDDAARARMRTGDYVGIYAEDEGLDVTHAGIAILSATGILFRHASQLAGKVVDQDLAAYLAGKPGIVVLRPR